MWVGIAMYIYGLVINFIPKKVLLYVHMVSMQPFIVLWVMVWNKQARTKRKIREIMITWQAIRPVLVSHISLISS